MVYVLVEDEVVVVVVVVMLYFWVGSLLWYRWW